jgi:adenylate cyclase
VALPLIAELQRRRVFRALVAYAVAAFAVLQIIEPIMHGLHWPDAVLSYVVVALAAGFPIVVTMAWIFDVNAGRIERTPPTEGLRRGWIAPLLVGLGLLAAAPGVYYYLVVRARPAVATVSQASIAVLPMVNMSRDPDQEYFADGLTEELLNVLAKVPGLHVAARTSAFSFKGKSDDARTIAEKLNVKTLLEGSRAQVGRSGAHHHPAHQRRRRLPPLVGDLRSQADGRLRRAGRDRAGGGRGAAAAAPAGTGAQLETAPDV